MKTKTFTDPISMNKAEIPNNLPIKQERFEELMFRYTANDLNPLEEELLLYIVDMMREYVRIK